MPRTQKTVDQEIDDLKDRILNDHPHGSSVSADLLIEVVEFLLARIKALDNPRKTAA